MIVQIYDNMCIYLVLVSCLLIVSVCNGVVHREAGEVQIRLTSNILILMWKSLREAQNQTAGSS